MIPATVLLVEDNKDIANVQTELLSSIGYTLYAANNAAEAQAILREKAPEINILFSDIRLGIGENGIVLARYVEQHYAWIRIVLMTGYSSKIAGLSEASWIILQKPVLSATIIEAFDRLMET